MIFISPAQKSLCGTLFLKVVPSPFPACFVFVLFGEGELDDQLMDLGVFYGFKLADFWGERRVYLLIFSQINTYKSFVRLIF